MDNYNPDLIFDLAAGLLPEDEARAAEASLTPEGRAELDAQRAVMAAIANEGPVAMTDIERARMHRTVADGIAATTRELSPVEIAPPQPARSAPRSTRWFRWASAATAAALFVGVVAVGSQLTGLTGDGDTADTAALQNLSGDQESAATTAAAAGALSTTTRPQALAGDGADITEDAATLEPPEVRSTSARDDLTSLALELQTAQRFSAPFDEDLTSLGCYDEASQDVEIVDWSFVTYVADDGSETEAIGYAIANEDGARLDILLYTLATCLPIDTE